MPEAVHMYITTILGALLLAIVGVTAWLVQAVIKNGERGAVHETKMVNIGEQLSDMRSQIAGVNRDMSTHIDRLGGKFDAGIEKLHERINVQWRELRSTAGRRNHDAG